MSTTESASAPSGAEEVGPIDVIVIGFPAGAPMTGDAAPLLVDLVDRGIIRVLDVLFVTKGDDGSVAGFEARDLTSKGIGSFSVFEGASSGLLGDEDAAAVGENLASGESAVAIVYENRWAGPFAAAVRRNGGQLIASERIPVADVIAALDAIEAAS